MATRKKSAAKAGPRKKSATNEIAPQAAPLKSAGAAQVAAQLAKAIPEPRCELRFENAFQLLIATILSAQSTDKAVNAVTPALFARYPTPRALAAADTEQVEVLIKRTGFFRAKTKSIRETAERLEAEFEGEVPRALEQLVRLKGVARKTANVVLGTAFGIASGFVVDTHVARVSARLGLTQHTEPGKIEQDLCALFPSEQWVDLGHRILLHGRYTCLAKAPMCSVCPLNEQCPSRSADAEGSVQQRAKAEAERVATGMGAV